jgi:hypothetical protein
LTQQSSTFYTATDSKIMEISECKHLKFVPPCTKSPIPNHVLPNLSPKQDYVNRYAVKSIFRPTLPDVVRQLTKKAVRDQLCYNPTSFNPDAEERVIPEEHLQAIFGTEHLQRQEEIKSLQKRVRHSNWSKEQRFHDPKFYYTQECAARSIMDAESKLPKRDTQRDFQK